MNYNIPLDPAAFATLQNTLTPEGVLSYMERQGQLQQKQLADTTRQATQEAQSASQDYMQATQQPVPEPDALAQFVPSLLGNIASVISQNPSYREQAQKDIHEKRQDLRQKRADNLLALKDMWDTKARLASSAGDREAEIKARQTSEQLSKTIDVMLENQREAHGLGLENLRHKHELEQIGARGRQDRLTQAGKLGLGTGPAGSPVVDNWVKLLTTGQATLSQVPNNIRTPVVNALSQTDNIILPTKVRQTINDLGAAESVMDGIEHLVAEVNTGGPKGSRIKQGIKSTIKGALQTDVDDAMYDKTMRGFLATIARSTGEKGVLTDRDSERARNLLPGRFDAKTVANAKVEQMRQFIRGQKARTIRNFTSTSSQLVQDPWRTGTWFAREDGKVYAMRKTDKQEGWIDPEDEKLNLFVPATPKLPAPK